MPVFRLPDLCSVRLDPYRNIRTTNLTRFSGWFIAESRPLVERLVQSSLVIESILVQEKYADEAMDRLPPEYDLLIMPDEQVSELVGFAFHRGYLACGIRPKYFALDRGLLSQDPNWMGVMLVGLQDPENMGSILRSCAALGISDIFIGPGCVDPFARRVLRVSMGNAFKLKYFEAKDSLVALEFFRGCQMESVAACLSDTSEDLSQFRRNGSTLVVLGNEAHGLPQSVQNAADRRIRIEMELGTDSLNVSVAAGILLHNLRRELVRISKSEPNGNRSK